MEEEEKEEEQVARDMHNMKKNEKIKMEEKKLKKGGKACGKVNELDGQEQEREEVEKEVGGRTSEKWDEHHEQEKIAINKDGGEPARGRGDE